MALNYPTTSAALSKEFTSYGGSDVRLVIQGKSIVTAQGLSYAIQREKAPIYVMGSKDPKSFSRGKRGIAGTLIALMLDTHILLDPNSPFADMASVVAKDELYPSPTDLDNAADTSDLTTVDPDFQFDATNVSDSYTLQNPLWYIDQLPPFDIVVVAVNEYGKAATMRIYGIEILNEGSGFSVDDIVIEGQYTWVGRSVLPWRKLGEWDSSGTFQQA